LHHFKDDTFAVTVARTVEEVLALKETWESFNPIPVASLQYFLAQLETNQQALSPYVMVLRSKHRVEGMLVARVEEKHLEFKFGYTVLLRPEVRSISLVDGGVLGEASAAHCQAYFAELLGSLRRKEADIAFFEGIRNDSTFYDSGLMQPLLCRDYFSVEIPRYMLTLPTTYDDFFKGRKKRKKLRGLLRRLEKHYPGQVIIRMFTKEEDIDTLCRDAEAVSQKTYLHAMGEGFVDTKETRALLRVLASQGKLRAYIIYIEETPGAYLNGYSHQNIHYDTATGFDPQYKKFELGTILMFREIEELCEDQNIAFIDNGPGDQWYKRRYCDLAWDEASFFIFAPTITGMKLNGFRMFAGFADRSWGKILSSLNLKETWAKYKRNLAEKRLANEKKT